MSIIAPNMLTKWYMFGPHWPPYVRVLPTALLIWVKRQKHTREIAARTQICGMLRLHKAKRRPLFENQKFDISSRDRRNPYAKMGEEIPREGPLSMGALYLPIWVVSQKGLGGSFRFPTLYIRYVHKG